jgi:hypothetical protein
VQKGTSLRAARNVLILQGKMWVIASVWKAPCGPADDDEVSGRMEIALGPAVVRVGAE